MKRALLVLVWFLAATSLRAQISGAGQVGCTAAPVTGTGWTSSTSNNTTQILASNVAGAQVLVTLDQGSTISGGAVTFQGDPGDGNFVTLAPWQVVDPTTAPFAVIGNPYTLVASTNKQFLVLMGGMSRLQLKLSPAITGSATVTPFTTVACYQLPLSFQASAANLQSQVTQVTTPWVVAGPDAVGAAPSTNPNQVGGVSQAGTVQRASTSSVMPTGSETGLVVRDASDQAMMIALNGILKNTAPRSPLAVPAPIAVTTNANPCINNVPGDAPISQAASAQVITGRPGLRILVCHERLTVSAAEEISEMEGTGTTCATGTIYHSGSSTAANGEQLAAAGAGYETNVPFYLLPGNNYCIQQAGTSKVGGKVSYLYVP